MVKRPHALADLPGAAPVFPLSGGLLLPNTNRPFNIFEPRYIAMIDHILGGDRMLVLVQPVARGVESPEGVVPLRRIGCLGRLVHFEETGEERYFIVLEGLIRVELGEEIEAGTLFRQFHITPEPFASDFEPAYGENAVDRQRFLEMMRSYAEYANLDLDWEEVERTGTADLVNLCCMLSPYGADEKQVLLEARTLKARADTLIAMAEVEMARTGNALQ